MIVNAMSRAFRNVMVESPGEQGYSLGNAGGLSLVKNRHGLAPEEAAEVKHKAKSVVAESMAAGGPPAN
jgi:hypothetical protein